jgi:glycosyltransferase involved in cell wall biosynthesis
LKTKKHILFLTPGFPENEEDTTCIPALQIFMSELHKSNQVDISVITFQYPFKAGIYHWNSIKVHAIGGKNSKHINRLLTWKKVKQTTKLIHREKPIDQIHSFWLNECAYIGALISTRMKLPHTCTLMGQDVLSANTYFNRIKDKPKLIALSQFQADTLFDNFQVRPDLIIPWGINEFQKARSSERSIDIIGIGSLTHLKGFNHFIKTIGEIQKNIPDIRSEIIGDGPEMENLKRQITSQNLEDNIALIGKLERKYVIEKLYQSKVLLHFF